jgi:hypothetical protein
MKPEEIIWGYDKYSERGLGDRLAAALIRCGIRGWSGCGCARRRAWLNRFGERIAGLTRRLVRNRRDRNGVHGMVF